MSSLPSLMEAVVLPSIGGAEQLQYTESHPIPKLNDGQILVKNNFSGVNFVDIYFRKGAYPTRNYPVILGQEAAGTVVAIQGANPFGFNVGDRVVWIGQGGYAEYTAISAGQAIKIPEEVSDEDAVGGHLMGMTALSLVEEGFPVQKGHTVLVHAAAGGVGLLLCQILKDKGAITIGTAGGPEKCGLAIENGATHMINYNVTSGPTWAEQVMSLTSGQGVDVVYDSIGQDTWEDSIKVSKRKGKVVYFGSASGPVPPINPAKLREKNVSVLLSTLQNSLVTREELEYYAYGILEMIKGGKLKIRKHKTYSLKEVAQAHIDLEGRKTMGKLLIKL